MGKLARLEAKDQIDANYLGWRMMSQSPEAIRFSGSWAGAIFSASAGWTIGAAAFAPAVANFCSFVEFSATLAVSGNLVGANKVDA